MSSHSPLTPNPRTFRPSAPPLFRTPPLLSPRSHKDSLRAFPSRLTSTTLSCPLLTTRHTSPVQATPPSNSNWSPTPSQATPVKTDHGLYRVPGDSRSYRSTYIIFATIQLPIRCLLVFLSIRHSLITSFDPLARPLAHFGWLSPWFTSVVSSTHSYLSDRSDNVGMMIEYYNIGPSPAADLITRVLTPSGVADRREIKCRNKMHKRVKRHGTMYDTKLFSTEVDIRIRCRLCRPTILVGDRHYSWIGDGAGGAATLEVE